MVHLIKIQLYHNLKWQKPLKIITFGFSLDETLKYAKSIEYKSCEGGSPGPNDKMTKVSMNFWHNFANQYMPIKNEIINL